MASPQQTASLTLGGWQSAASLILLITLLALVARLPGLGEATTEDEDQWIQRAGDFGRALDLGRLRDTFRIGHPGVTTTWLVRLALGPERTRAFAGDERGDLLVTQVPDFLPALHRARIPFALLNAALVGLNVALAWRLLGAAPALLGGLLLALSPYWSALSPIVGMDALLAGLSCASLLCSRLAFPVTATVSGAPRRWALVAGLLAGLAALTKATALFLIPFAALLCLQVAWPGAAGRGRLRDWRLAFATLRVTATSYAIWLFGLALSALLWPALWSAPLATLRRAFEFIRTTSTTPHAPPNFFLGQPVLDPGPLFYPVALVLHLGPATTLGLIALLLLRRRAGRSAVSVAASLLDFVVLFVIVLTLSPKKVDRYILPALLPLDLLAGLGWYLLLARLTALPRVRLSHLLPGAALVVLLQAWPLLQAGPHPLSAYNPLFGGLQAAEWALPVGWGEGLDAAGAYLASQPGAENQRIGVWYPLWVNFQAHVPGKVDNLFFRVDRSSDLSAQERFPIENPARFAHLDYYVDYIHAHQRRLIPRQLDGLEPEYVVTINGAVYVRVFRLR